jgi:hypothetical protein
MIAEKERLDAVIDHARNNFFTGQFNDQEALDRAFELGLVEKFYQCPAGFFVGLSKLRLTAKGVLW